MRTQIVPTLAGIIFLVGSSFPVRAEEESDLMTALSRSRALLSVRYRYENVDDEALEKEAHASTLRAAAGFRTASWRGLGLLATAEMVGSVGNDSYNNAGFGGYRNGVQDRPVVADPAGIDVGELYLGFDRGDFSAQLGRAEVGIDDQRFIGAVAWRQHHQTFNALKLTNQSLEWARFLYAYLDRVYRINRDRWDTSSHLLNARFRLGELGSLTPYAYLLDFDDQPQYGLSSASYGLELVGQVAMGESGSVEFEAEYALQQDYGSNPNRLRADYLFLMAKGNFKRLGIQLGYEVLSGNESDGQFRTPLATLHKFNGWADRFLNTPTDGLEDLFLSLDGTVGPLAWAAVYHDFSAESTSTAYGDEVDLQLLYTAPWKQEFGLKGAFYKADELSTDVSKLWVFTTFKI